VPGNDGFRFQGLKLIERGDPLNPALCVSLAQKGMDAIIDDVAANDQSDLTTVSGSAWDNPGLCG